jgi:hypothetical protein
VFEGTFGVLGIPNATIDPGFDSEVGGLPPTAQIGISIRRALRVWNGADFETIPDEKLKITKQQTEILTNAADPALCQLSSLVLGVTSSTGHLHEHVGFELLAPADAGIYLLELEAWVGQFGNATSEPFWILFNQNEPAATLEEAEEYVSTILPCVPDFNRSGSLTIADFGSFQAAFAAGSPRADLNRDCANTIADFGAFQALFVEGCP